MSGVADDGSSGRAMHAMVMRDFGGPEVLVAEEVPLPQPGPSEVRIRVHAVMVNNTRDVLTRGGGHVFSRFVTPPHILGGEHAGVVDAVGAGVDPGRVGERVVASAALPCDECEFCLAGQDERCVRIGLIGVHRQGAYAEYAVAPVSNIRTLSEDVSAADAVALMTTGPVGLAQLTAATVGEGDVLVVPGVSGALGSMVAALATMRGVRVVGLARDIARAQALSLPVAAIVDVAGDDLAGRLREACAPSGAHAIVDNVCVQPIFDAGLEVLRTGGRIVISGQMGNDRLAFDPRRLYLANHSIVGVRTGSRTMQAAFWELVRDGFRLPADLLEVFLLTSAADVHRLIESGGKVGHVALMTDGAGTGAELSS